MSSADKMDNFIDNYSELWEVLLGEGAGFGIIDHDDYYGRDTSGKNRLLMLFYNGQMRVFPGIWIGDTEEYEENLETYPIYFCNLADNEESLIYQGNFRNYMQDYLDVLECYVTEENFSDAVPASNDLSFVKFKRMILDAKEDLRNFSNECITFGSHLTKEMLTRKEL